MPTKTSNVLLGLLIIQNSVGVLIARHISANFNYDVKKLVFIAECLKLFLSMIIEGYAASKSSNNSTNSLFKSLYQHVWLKPCDTLKLSIPALLYLLQSIFAFIAIKMIPVPLFLILQQTKLVKTTLLSILMLRRSYSFVQWLSIIVLCIGSSLTFLSINRKKETETVVEIMVEEEDGMTRNLMGNIDFSNNVVGILLVLASNFCSSFAGVYFELVIKGVDKSDKKVVAHRKYELVKSGDEEDVDETTATTFSYDSDDENNEGHNKNETNAHDNEPSLWMRNVQLSFFTLCILLADTLRSKSHSTDETPIFGKFNVLMWIQIVLFAFGGLLVAAVIKNADNVQRGICMALSVILTSAVSMFIDSSNSITPQFVFGATLAIAGCFIFVNPTLISEMLGGQKKISR